MQIKINELVSLTSELMVSRGLSSEEAKMVNDHLLEAELSNRPSHGFMRIPRICDRLDPSTMSDVKLVKETPVSGLLDGGAKPGFVVAYKAMEIGIIKAQENHISIVGGFNTDNIGIAGFYVREAARNGLVGIATANSPSKIPPWGGVEPIMGTNPLAIGIPSTNMPIVLDFACSKVTFGDVLLAAREGKTFEPNILLDENGDPTTDPNDVRSGGIGSILAIGDHKGAGLALMLEILAGPLVQAKGGRKAVPDGGWGFFFIFFNPEILTDVSDFYTKVDKMIDEIKNIKKMPGIEEIFLPGERTARNISQNSQKDDIEISSKVYEEIIALQS